MENKKTLFKNWKFLFLLILSLILAVGVAVSAFFYFKNTAKLDLPTNLTFSNVNNEVYASVDKVNGNIRGYEFVLNGAGNPKSFFSKTNMIEISSYFQKPATYSVKCRVIGLTDKACSEFCTAKTYVSSVKVATPTISVDTSLNRLIFAVNDTFFENVELSFKLIYGIDSNNNPLVNTNFVLNNTTDNKGYYYGYFDLSFLPDGEYSLSVKAISAKTGYINSDISNQIAYTANNVE